MKRPREMVLSNRPLGPSWTLQPPTPARPEPACRDAGVTELWWLWRFIEDDARERLSLGVTIA